MDRRLIFNKISSKQFVIVFTVSAFVLFTIWHCLYHEPLIDDCSLGFLGTHQILRENSQLRNVISYIFLTLFIVNWFIYSSKRYESLIKIYQKTRSYLKEKLFASDHSKLFDQLRLAYAKGIIKSKIYTAIN